MAERLAPGVYPGPASTLLLDVLDALTLRGVADTPGNRLAIRAELVDYVRLRFPGIAYTFR